MTHEHDYLALDAVVAELLEGLVCLLDAGQQLVEVMPVHSLHDFACIQRAHTGG